MSELHVDDLVPLLLRAGQGEMPARERELAILRITYLTETAGEWERHVRLGLDAGIGVDEIAAVRCGPEHPDWSWAEAVLLRAVDELHHDAALSEPTRELLGIHLDRPQMLELIAVVSVYVLAGYVLERNRVRLDDRLN
ncbi:carboxymuconolactone decarboxylase family protein [Spirillospora sp. NPDC052269]